MGPSVLSAPWPGWKVSKLSTFRAATDQSANHVAVMQIHYWTLANEIAFVIQPGKTRGYVNVMSMLMEIKNGGESYHCCGQSPNSV